MAIIYIHLQTTKIGQKSMEYPALEDVYDMSTQDLKNLQQKLRSKPDANEQLLETIILQIQQRKALQYFAQLCKAENPYAKKVAAFNQQFLKLAAEEIAKNHHERSQGIGEYQPSNISLPVEKIQNKITKSQQNIGHQIDQYQSTKSTRDIKSTQQQRQNTDVETRSVQSQTHSVAQSDAISTTTTGTGSMSRKSNNQQTSSRVSGDVKLNIGNKKTDKNKLKGIESILARTKVEDNDIVIKRNNMMSPHSINPHKKYHIPGEKRQSNQLNKPNSNTQTKTKKSIQAPQSSQKSIKQPNNSKNTKAVSSQQSKKIQQVTSKMKQQSKKGTVKLPKINQYKDLVEMVKQQQQKKKQRANRIQMVQKLPYIESNSQKSKSQKYGNDQKSEQDNQLHRKQSIQYLDKIRQEHQTQQANPKFQQTHASGKSIDDKQLSSSIDSIQTNQVQTQQNISHSAKSNSSKNTSNQRKKSSELMSRDNQIIKEEQMQESLSPNKIQKLNSQGSAHPHDQNVVRPNTTEGSKNSQQFRQKNNKVSGKDSVIEAQGKQKQMRKTSYELKEQNQINQNNLQKIESSNHINSVSLQSQKSNNQAKNKNQNANEPKQPQNVDYTKKIIQQIQKQQQSQYHFFGSNPTQELNITQPKYNDNDYKDKNSNNTDQNSQNNQTSQHTNQITTKKCYSEQYWAHIREQAQLKIKRFKQEKQYEQNKQISKQQTANLQHYQEQREKQDESEPDSIDSNSPGIDKLKQQEAAFQKQIAEKQDQLNKLKKQVMKKTSTKVAEAMAVPKLIRPKPEFDYFSVYPTFNHIFSVMYLKPASQAVSQVPNIMRDIKTLFTTHMQHFGNKTNFKPAIFLPFDGTGAFQLTDPKQLISHAQQTYIDLKVMIERVQIFNQNLHGNFNNAVDDMYYRVVKTKEEVYDIITTSFMRRKGWKQLPHGCSLRSSWNLFWSWSKPDIDISKLLVWQKINHFPFNKNLSRKDLLYKNLDFFRKNYKVAINFLPLTYNLPKQFSQLSAKFHEQQMLNKDFNYWIMKPIGKSRGRGIKVVSSLSQLNYTDNIVVQKYIANPMLIDGYKFDMRIYVLVTSFHPLEAFVYREGFARLSTQKYSLDPHSIKNTFVHLTNFAINKNNVASNSNFAGGSKISLKTLKDKVTRMGYSFSNIWAQVHDIIVKSLLGCSVSVPSFPTAFQLFGYDIMVDQQCNCHLIQINASPSLERSYMLDQIVKQNLIDDIIDIVDPPDFDKKQLLDVFNERIQAMTNKKKITAEDDLIGLARILRYKPIRKIGEMPAKMGLFEVVAPCDTSRQLQKLIKAKSGANNPMNID